MGRANGGTSLRSQPTTGTRSPPPGDSQYEANTCTWDSLDELGSHVRRGPNHSLLLGYLGYGLMPRSPSGCTWALCAVGLAANGFVSRLALCVVGLVASRSLGLGACGLVTVGWGRDVLVTGHCVLVWNGHLVGVLFAASLGFALRAFRVLTGLPRYDDSARPQCGS